MKKHFYRIFKDYWCTNLITYNFSSDLACNKISKTRHSTHKHINSLTFNIYSTLNLKYENRYYCLAFRETIKWSFFLMNYNL